MHVFYLLDKCFLLKIENTYKKKLKIVGKLYTSLSSWVTEIVYNYNIFIIIIYITS